MTNPLIDILTVLENRKADKCDIIDIANEEMKRIDSSKIDSEFRKVFYKTLVQQMIDAIADGNYTQKDLDSFLKSINDEDVLDVRVSEKSLYFKTNAGIVPVILAHILDIEERCIEQVPINGKYSFFRIDTLRWSTPIARERDSYNPVHLVDVFKDIGADCIEEDEITNKLLYDIVKKAFLENWKDEIDFNIKVEVEDKVVAIAFDRFIFNAKEVVAETLKISDDLFTEVSTPIGTVLLIDTRRWYLENLGDEEWYL